MKFCREMRNTPPTRPLSVKGIHRMGGPLVSRGGRHGASVLKGWAEWVCPGPHAEARSGPLAGTGASLSKPPRREPCLQCVASQSRSGNESPTTPKCAGHWVQKPVLGAPGGKHEHVNGGGHDTSPWQSHRLGKKRREQHQINNCSRPWLARKQTVALEQEARHRAHSV